jgi:hypothetical protein
VNEPDEQFIELAMTVGLHLSRLIGLSKTGFIRRHPQHAAIFNATIADAEGRRLWWGDLDLTVDEEALHRLAERAGLDLYIYYEGDSRRGFVERIHRSNVLAVFHPDRTVTLGTRSSLFRTPFGRIMWQPSDAAATHTETEQ